jgi:hypothetical protein
MSLLDLPMDIKAIIIDYLPWELWEWLVIHDDEILRHSLAYRKYYIKKYTVHENDHERYPTKTWKIFDKFHREPKNKVDKPAWIHKQVEYYYRNGLLHRDPNEDKEAMPAVVGHDLNVYFINGNIHRVGKPAVIEGTSSPTRKYKMNLPIDEKNDPDNNFTFEYYFNGNLHREDDENGIPQPAIIHGKHSGDICGQLEYFQNGNYFRSDGGTTLIHPDGCGAWLLNISRDDYVQVHDNYVFINAPNKKVVDIEFTYNIDIVIDIILYMILFIIFLLSLL